MPRFAAGWAAALALLASGPASWASSPPSTPDLTAPILAPLGPFPIGWREVRLEPEEALGARPLDVLVWYPAKGAGRAGPYRVELPAGPGRDRPTPARFAAAATADAPPAGGPFPLIVLSHGFGNAPEWMSWLGENLASKGYVVVAPRHHDPVYTGAQSLAEPLIYRPLDQALAASRTAARLARDGGAWRGLVDARRWALVGYSMGGSGALAAAQARLDPASPAMALAPVLKRRAEGGSETIPTPPGLAAVVLIAPWGGQAEASLYRGGGLRAVAAPVLILAGDADEVSGYEGGVRRLYEGLECADRWLFTFERAGHNLGTNPAPEVVADWLPGWEAFEDTVWRKPRLNGVSQHLVTAFLDLQLKSREDRRAYLVRPTASPPAWSGFRRERAPGLRAEMASASCGR